MSVLKCIRNRNVTLRRLPITKTLTENLLFHPPRDSSSLFRSGYNPEDVVVQIDSREYIINQILTLPFTEAQTILLRFYGNLKYDEIAGLMDISRSSVKRYLKSGMNHLVKIFQPQKGEFYP